jgi:signal transduction histidine kinase
VASPGSYIRSAARVTFSAYRRVPIRWRLAGGSAVLTLIILAGFAAIVGTLTSRQVRSQFNDEVRSAVDQLYTELNHNLRFVNATLNCNRTTVHLSDYASAEHALIRIYDSSDGSLLCTQSSIRGAKGAKSPKGAKGAKSNKVAPPTLPAPSLFPAAPQPSAGTFTQSGYRVAVRNVDVKPIGTVTLLYARPLSDVDHTLARVQVFLLLGVLGGTILALLAGLATAQRAMRPIAGLTEAAREIERTRDASAKIPHPEAHDEIEELARTLEGMLASLDAARSDTQDMLDRQREFVADASHELRTPLTSVLANLELLTEELGGEQAETAEAALRSTRRMRRLVGDLLLLARADAKRVQPHRPTDLSEVLIEAASELGPMAEHHELSLAPEPVIVEGVRDELHRLVLNLLENAVRHTPPGTRVSASTATVDGEAVLTVQDDGPGISPTLEKRVFERFVRGGRDGGRGSGLGLAIVRAVAESHGGTVILERPEGGTGTRFVIRIPSAGVGVPEPEPEPVVDQTSTTTGRTIGRRRNRS